MDSLTKEAIAEIRADVKKLLVDVGILKYKAGIYGMIGSAIFLTITFIAKKMGVI